MARDLEKPIEMEILNMLAYVGIFAFKIDRQGTFDPQRKVFRSNKNPHKIRGVSDILGIHEGRFIAIEVKSLKGRPTDEQRVFLARINAEGGIAFIARSARSAAEELAKHFPNNLKLKAYLRHNLDSSSLRSIQ